MKLETFFEKFDQFADAPDAVTKMRELILQLAVIGKLCPQDSLEEPASVLLSKIAGTNKRRYASGEIRLRENARVSEHLEVSVPIGWSFVALGEIADVNWGNTSLTKKSYSESGFTAYSATGPDGWIEHAEFSGPGIVLSAIGARSGKCFLADGQWTAIKNTITIIPFSPISNDWLFRAINRESAWKKRGGAQPFIALKDAISLPLLLPPLAEQKRIVAKVDELMALCDRLEAQQQEREMRHAALARASLARFADAPTPDNLPFLFHPSYAIPPSDLRKSILTLAVQGKLVPQDPNDEPAEELRDAPPKAERKKAKWAGQVEEQELPFQLPPSWKWLRLGDVSSLKHGYAFSSNFFTSEPASFVLTTPGNFYEKGGFRDRESKRKYYSGPVDPEFIFKPGDLIIPMTEQAAGLLGSPAFIPNDGRVYIHNQRLGKLSFSESIAPEFAFWFFNCDFFRGELARTCTGMKVRHTSPDRVLKVPFPVPPLAEQRRIVAKVSQLMALVDALETQLAASRATAANLLSALVAELTTA
jgi:type I restriction enzyme S subunit